jgi:hypothetical protein
MWGEHKIWHRFLNDIIAADSGSAHFLATYLDHIRISKKYICSLEVVDLQKYKIITQPVKVRIAMRERLHIPFIFLNCRN